jgi:hypothetical protein
MKYPADHQGIELKTAVAGIVQQIGKTMNDVDDVRINHPTDPTRLIIFFTDGSQATVEIERPLQ